MSYFFDISGRSQSVHAGQGRGFRIGDRAAAYVRILLWRTETPDVALHVIDDVSWPESVAAREFSADWLFRGLNATTHVLARDEAIDLPGTYDLYDQSLWEFWKSLRFTRPVTVRPTIRPPKSARETAISFLTSRGWNDLSFIVIQPLFDATYNTHRNMEWSWWMTIVEMLAAKYKVVVAIDPRHAASTNLSSGNVAFTSDGNLTPMEVLALIEMSSLFIGGETGLTLWAPIVKAPTYGMIHPYSLNRFSDTAPISFGSPICIQTLNLSPAIHVIGISEFISTHGLIR